MEQGDFLGAPPCKIKNFLEAIYKKLIKLVTNVNFTKFYVARLINALQLRLYLCEDVHLRCQKCIPAPSITGGT